MKVRRVVTKNGPDGRGVVVSDDPAPRTHDFVTIPAMSQTLVWSSEPSSALDGVDLTAAVDNFVPGAGATRFIVLQIPPDGPADSTIDPRDVVAESLAASPGIAERFEPDGSGMHEMSTIDYVVVIRGVLDLDLGAGQVLSLYPGDVAVQCGARHAWRNHTDEPAVAAFVLVGLRDAEVR